MAQSTSPIVVLVHGAWHGGWCFARLQAELDARGIPSLAPDLPGHGASLAAFGDLRADAAHVASVVSQIEAPVVLVGHSYGGAVITEAASDATNVRHLIYLTAFVLDAGESVIGLVQSMPPVETALSRAMVIGDGFSTIDPDLARDAFYGHCDPAAGAASSRRLCAQPQATFVQPATATPWKSIPSTFVRCTNDEAIPLALQDVMAPRCSSVVTLDTDHSPFNSMPVETADIIADVVASLASAP